MSTIFSQLNTRQQNAIRDLYSVVLIKAGPGTGKTLTLIAKIVKLLDQGVPPKKIVAITFTRRAAQEIKERLTVAAPAAVKRLNLGTFHSLALGFLGIEPQQLILTQPQHFLAQKIIRDQRLKLKSKELLNLIAQSKNKTFRLKPIKSFLQKAVDCYQQELAEKNLLDFDDLLLKFLAQLQAGETLKADYLLVDEFQDVSPVQYDIVKTWVAGLKQTFLIGDPRQAIYGFRGASDLVFTQLKTDFPKLSEHNLLQNYRSCEEIITVAQRLFPQDEKLIVQSRTKGLVANIATANQFTETDWIIHDIEKKIGGTGLLQASEFYQEQEASLADFAIIYRIHQLGMNIADKLQQVGLPYQQVGQQSLYLTSDVALVLKLWQLSALTNLTKQKFDWDEDQLWLELLANKLLKISSQSWVKLNQFKQTQKSGWRQAIKSIIGQKILQPRQENKLKFVLNCLESPSCLIEKSANLVELLDEIQADLVRFKIIDDVEKSLPNWPQLRVELLQFVDCKQQMISFLRYVADLEKHDYYDQQAEKITLLTMHAAKGLEFDWVYLLGFEEGLVPLKVKQEKQTQGFIQLNEEKNLFYVTLTRAKKGCYLLTTQHRWQKKVQASQFWQIIQGEPVQMLADPVLTRRAKVKQKQVEKSRQSSLF